MSDIDAVDRDIQALQQLQRAAWQQLADGKTTSAVSMELRKALRKSTQDLREILSKSPSARDFFTQHSGKTARFFR